MPMSPEGVQAARLKMSQGVHVSGACPEERSLDDRIRNLTSLYTHRQLPGRIVKRARELRKWCINNNPKGCDEVVVKRSWHFHCLRRYFRLEYCDVAQELGVVVFLCSACGHEKQETVGL